MSRRYFNLASGTTDGPHDDTTTTIQFTSAPDFDLEEDEHVVIAWGRFADRDTVEIIHLNGPYTAGSTSATIERGQEGTAAKSHTDGEEWRLVTTASDLNNRAFGFRPETDLGLREIAAGFARGYARYYVNDTLMDTRDLASGWVGTANQSGFDGGPWIKLTTGSFASKARLELNVRFDRSISLNFKAMTDDTAADSTRVVYVDGVSEISTANVDDYGSPTTHSIDIGPGAHTIGFEFEHNSDGAASAYFGDISTSTDDAPEDGEHFQEFSTHYVYVDGEYRPLGGSRFDGEDWHTSFGVNHVRANSAVATGIGNVVEAGEDAAVVVGENAVAKKETVLGGATNTGHVGLQVGIGNDVIVQAESVGVGYSVRAGAEATVTGAFSQGQAQDTVYGYSISCPPLEAAGSHLEVTNFAAAVSGVGTLGPADSFTYTIVPYNGFGFGSSSTATVEDVLADNAVDLTWDAATGATGYRIYGRSDNIASGKQRFLADVATTSWTDDGSVDGEIETVPTATSLERTFGPRVAVGHTSQVNAPYGIAIGALASVFEGHERSTALGPGVSTTKANQNLIGDDQNVTTLPGGLELGLVNVTGTTTLDTSQKETVVLADATAAAFTITLPDADPGRVVVVKKIDSSANAVTVEIPGGATPPSIDGAANQSLASQYDVIRLISDGTDWFLI